MASYAEQFGARPASRGEKLARGFKPNTRAYTMPDGEVVSHRRMQTMGLRERYGEGIEPRGALEERARIRREELGLSSPRRVFDKMVQRFATAPTRQGGLGMKYDKRTREFIDRRTGEHLTFQEVARTREFRDIESGHWPQWQRIRHAKGPKGKRMRFNFLRRLGYFVYSHGGWRYINY